MSDDSRRRRRRQIRATSDGVPDAVIYERDAWACQMPACQAPKSLGPARRVIDPALTGTDSPWAPSVDHVVALAHGGQDVAENKRAAHRCCNNAARPRTPKAPVPDLAGGAKGTSEENEHD